MEAELQDLKPGDHVSLVFDDAPDQSTAAVIESFSSNRSLGFSPEIADYVSCWIRLETEDQKTHLMMLGADLRYSLNGRKLTVHKQG